MRDIEKQIESNDRAKLAFDLYTSRLKQYIGAYIATLGGVNVLIFTDDIGVKSWRVREAVCNNLEFCGISIDTDRNQTASTTGISEINRPDAKVKILAMPTDEESVICREGLILLNA